MARIQAMLLALAALAAAAPSNRTCYFPDGTESPADMPCSDAATTHCCNSRNACLSTGYCMSAEQQPYVLSRGSCTDSGWGTGCPSRCASSADNPGGGRPMSWMGTQNSAGAWLYCCGTVTVDSHGDLACENDASSFTLGASTLMYGAAILANTTTNTTDVATAPSSPAETAPACPSSSPTDSANSNNKDSSTTAVGAGVGVSLGVVAAAALCWAVWERRKRTKLLQDVMSGRLPAEMSDGAGMVGMSTGSTLSPGGGGYGKVHSSPPQPLAELPSYPRQELPAQHQ